MQDLIRVRLAHDSVNAGNGGVKLLRTASPMRIPIEWPVPIPDAALDSFLVGNDVGVPRSSLASCLPTSLLRQLDGADHMQRLDADAASVLQLRTVMQVRLSLHAQIQG